VLHKVNERNPSPTRNLGLKEAKGEYIAFLDADDQWMPEKLARQVAVLDQKPAVGLVYTASVVKDREGKTIRVGRCLPEARGRIHPLLRVRNMMVASSVMARRAAIEEVGGYDESLTSAENWDLWIRIARRWEVDFVDEPLTVYRMHGSGLSANVESRRRNVFRIIAKHHDPGDRSPEARRLRRDAYFNAYYQVLGMAYFDRLEMGEAALALWRAFCLKPRRDVARLLALSLLGRRPYLALRGLRARFRGQNGGAET
jgi:glycosyltransferase involved in cell wall biosynthesis